MGKGKLRKFKENETFNHVIEPDVKEFVAHNHHLKGKWRSDFFKNNNPIILELGCGKGEYSVGLARKNPNNNYIGVDIKGARIWKGAKTSFKEQINNIAFLRTRIELINSFFSENEADEIWVTFPDPQMKKKRTKKRLTSTLFLSNYQKLLKQNGIVHLKTDSRFLYEYTNAVVKLNELTIIKNTADLYSENWTDEILSIQTHYEKLHIDEGDTIHYISFVLDKNKTLVEPDFQHDDD